MKTNTITTNTITTNKVFCADSNALISSKFQVRKIEHLVVFEPSEKRKTN